ncbi:hypothetical protein BDZ94DRAFT_1271330 [Collybia nuda]|uniref:Secreted protein n=1 Tax=Collybia nuda TaxID=64659 RepID=A0A9P5XUT3_9AGAR|nr:hypothetical protein BDZ94DRAFT_1271330 [Collybia nuda]
MLSGVVPVVDRLAWLVELVVGLSSVLGGPETVLEFEIEKKIARFLNMYVVVWFEEPKTPQNRMKEFHGRYQGVVTHTFRDRHKYYFIWP